MGETYDNMQADQLLHMWPQGVDKMEDTLGQVNAPPLEYGWNMENFNDVFVCLFVFFIIVGFIMCKFACDVTARSAY